MKKFNPLTVLRGSVCAALLFTLNFSQAGLVPPDPVPTAKPTNNDLIRRYRGQTEFLSLQGSQFRASGLEERSGGAPPGGSPQSGNARQEQESDVFKIGEANSKLLYLLNNYRGLQVVSFKNGLEKPELLGRADTKGSWSDDLYFDAKNKRIYILERTYNPNNGYGTWKSQISVYSVQDPTKPVLVKEISIPGEMADHRMVGEVLYVATSEYPNQNQFGNSNAGKGHVFSFELTGDDVKQVDHMELSRAVSYRENMSIHTIKNTDGSYSYYLAAILSQTRWGWSDQRSYVELVDISDPKGKINPLFTASARGTVNKRSQVQIKNNTLVVVSNYIPPVKNAVQRIAVETFSLPVKGKIKTIDTLEADYRSHWIEYQAKKAGDEVEKRESAYNEAISDEKMGLRNLFVVSNEKGPMEGRLQKWAADKTLVTKDLRNQNTTIFDVRASEKFLYVFWFPGSKDPLEVFTFDAPQEKIEHLVHKEFEGWISRSFPVQYKGRELLIGLGYRPIEGAQPWQRRPQAVLFDVVQAGELADAKIIATSELSKDANVWTNFDGQDKMTEIRFESDFAESGKGYLLFQLDSWGKSGKSGGKLVGFDLSKTKTDPNGVFSSGAVLSGTASWLKRVFTNPELLSINTFSNESLGTFKVDGQVGKESDVVKAVSILELARNIRGYLTIGDKGFQIISENIEDGEKKSSISIRKVEANKPDVEKTQVLADVKVAKGNLNDFYLKEKTLFLFSSEYRVEKKEELGKPVSYESFWDNQLTMVDLSADKPKVVGTPLTWTEGSTVGRFGVGLGRPWMGYHPQGFALVNNELLLSSSQKLRKVVVTGEKISTSDIDSSACKAPGKEVVFPNIINGKIYASYSQSIDNPENKNFKYSKNFVAFTKLIGAKLECGEFINIPGQVIGSGKNHIVTQDSRFAYMQEYDAGDGKKSSYPVSKPCLTSLSLKNKTATLVDLFEDDKVSLYGLKIAKGHIFTTLGNYTSSSSRRNLELLELGFDKDLQFTSRINNHNLMGSYWMISEIFTVGNQTLFLVSNGTQNSVLEWTAGSGTKIRKVSTIDEVTGEKSKPADYFSGKGWYYYGSSNGIGKTVQWDETQKSLNFAEGFYGIKRVLLD